MRLLNTSSMQLEEFLGIDVPRYAILSHTWEREEVSFQDMQDGTAAQKAGYSKIEGSCIQAVLDNLSYIWIDTCCIDKSSSSELTEAINSMYRWYQNSEVCYAYLTDVKVPENGETNSSNFEKSRWFTRGWTLQELIAPHFLRFYSGTWEPIGTKAELKRQISRITGVDDEVLNGWHPEFSSVAARMFWASKRYTTRVEDIAYCLMGLFNVNMPLLYGEGERAFFRLQEEIMKTSDDHSLFAWTRRYPTYSGMLATSPAYFAKSMHIIPTQMRSNNIPFAITNRGLRIELLMVPGKGNNDHVFIAVLDCVNTRDITGPLGIMMQSSADEKFARIRSDEIFTVTKEKRLYKGIRLQSRIIYAHCPEDLPRFFNVFLGNTYQTRPLPVYESISSQSQPSQSFAVDHVPSFEQWTPVSYPN